jgi:serine/threonine protein kinase
VQIVGELRGPEYEPYFVQCTKTIRTDDATYLVMEYFPDGTLEEYVRKNGRFSDENGDNS